MPYTLGYHDALNDGHQFKGEPDGIHYVSICERRWAEGIEIESTVLPGSILYSAYSPELRSRLADDTLLKLYLDGYIDSTQLETLDDNQCRVLIGFSKAIFDGKLNVVQTLEKSLSAARIFHLIEKGNFAVLNCKNQLEQLSDEQVNNEVILPLIDSGFSVGQLYNLIKAGYLAFQEAWALTSTQALHLNFIYPTHGHLSFSEIKPLLRSDPAFKICVDHFYRHESNMLSVEELCALTPAEAERLTHDVSWDDYPYHDRDWTRMTIFNKHLGWPIKPVEEADKPSSLRHQLNTQIATGYLSETELLSLSHKEAKILINIYSELQQEALSFTEARPLLTWPHETFIKQFGPNPSGKFRLNASKKISMKLRDIACLTCDDIGVINHSYVDTIGAIKKILGDHYTPVAQTPSQMPSPKFFDQQASQHQPSRQDLESKQGGSTALSVEKNGVDELDFLDEQSDEDP